MSTQDNTIIESNASKQLELPIDMAMPDEPMGIEQAKQLLLDNVTSDVESFLAHWQACTAHNDDAYPRAMSADRWIEQFYAWMGV